MAAPNRIHPTAVVEGDVRLGAGNEIAAYSVLIGPLVLGDGNRIGPHAVVGTAGDELWQRDQDPAGKRVEIGSRCLIREHVTVHKPCYGDVTVLADDVYLMHGSYVAHDTRVEAKAVLAQNAVIGGVSRMLEGAYLAMGSALHQRAVVGQYAIVGAAAAAVRCVRPFSRYVPGRPLTLNEYAIDRHGFAREHDEIERYVREGRAPGSGRLGAMVEEYERLREESGRGEYT